MRGFIRGSVTRDLPIPGIDTIVSLFARGPQDSFGPVSYEAYLSLKAHLDAFEVLGAARESQGSVVLGERSSVMSAAAVTPELAELLDLSLDEGVVISHRVWQIELGGKADVRGEPIRIDGVDTRVAGVAPDWLEGLYVGRAVDIWMPLRETGLPGIDRASRTLWALGRLRPGVSTDQAQAAVNAARSGADAIAVLPYTGMTPEAAGGMSRIATLLSAAGRRRVLHRVRQRRLVPAGASVRPFARDICSRRARRGPRPTRQAAAVGQRAHLCDRRRVRHAAGRVDDAQSFRRSSSNRMPSILRSFRISSASSRPPRRVPESRSRVDWCRSLILRHDDPAAVLQRESVGTVEGDAPPARRPGGGADDVLLRARDLRGPSPRRFSHRAADERRPSSRPADSRHASSAQASVSRHETSDLGLKYFHDVERAAQSVREHLGNSVGGDAAGQPARLAVGAHRATAGDAPRCHDGRCHVHSSFARARRPAADRRADVRRPGHRPRVQGRHRQ